MGDNDDFGGADLVAITSAAERTNAPSAAPPPPRSSNTSTTAAGASTSTPPQRIVQPTPQALPQRATASAILVSPRQKGNPLLTHIHSLPWEYTDTPADYVLGRTTCALFLSLKYHRLHPEYIYTRIRALGKSYDLRVLLALVDIDAHEEPLRELAKTSLVNDFTLILAWSAREAARYLEGFKAMERAAPTAIKGAQSAGYAEKMVEFVTVPRGVNKADAVGIVSAFGSVRAAVNAHPEALAAVQGWGEVKVKRWAAVVREPFRTERASRKEGEGGEGFVSISMGRRAGLGRSETTLGEIGGRGAEGDEQRESNQPGGWEPGQDDEEAFLAATVTQPQTEEDVVPENGEPAPTAKRRRYEEPELDEGVAAALAKYRAG